MRQRAVIAIALACNPKILIADEITTALDVTIQAQVVNLLIKLQEEFELTTSKELYDKPLHPYTQDFTTIVENLNEKISIVKTVRKF